MVRRRAHVPDPLSLERLLEPRLALPGHELAAVVRQDLSRRAPLADRAFDHLQHRVGRLLTEQAPAYHEPAVVIDDADQVHRVHPLELEREDVDLPQRVGHRALEAADLAQPRVGDRRRIAQACGVDRLPHRLGAYLKAVVPPQVVADASHTAIRVRFSIGDDPPLEFGADLTLRVRRWPAAEPLDGAGTVL